MVSWSVSEPPPQFFIIIPTAHITSNASHYTANVTGLNPGQQYSILVASVFLINGVNVSSEVRASEIGTTNTTGIWNYHTHSS